MEALLVKNGLPVLHYPIYIEITVPAQRQVPIAQKMPSQIGVIYGLSVDATGFTPSNQPLITLANCDALYMTLRRGPSDFLLDVRLANLVYVQTATNFQNPDRYMPVNVPNNIDLDKSYFSNPTGLTAGVIKLNLWYIAIQPYEALIKAGKLMRFE